MKGNRWQVCVYRDGATRKGGHAASCEAREETARRLEDADAIAVYDRQKNRAKRTGVFQGNAAVRAGNPF